MKSKFIRNTTGKSMCPKCGTDFQLDFKVDFDNKTGVGVAPLGHLMMIECQKCKLDFPYFRFGQIATDPMWIEGAMVKAVDNFLDGLAGERGIYFGTAMMNGLANALLPPFEDDYWDEEIKAKIKKIKELK